MISRCSAFLHFALVERGDHADEALVLIVGLDTSVINCWRLLQILNLGLLVVIADDSLLVSGEAKHLALILRAEVHQSSSS